MIPCKRTISYKKWQTSTYYILYSHYPIEKTTSWQVLLCPGRVLVPQLEIENNGRGSSGIWGKFPILKERSKQTEKQYKWEKNHKIENLKTIYSYPQR